MPSAKYVRYTTGSSSWQEGFKRRTGEASGKENWDEIAMALTAGLINLDQSLGKWVEMTEEISKGCDYTNAKFLGIKGKNTPKLK